MLCAILRCAPSKLCEKIPAIPTIKKTKPRSLQTVFAIFLILRRNGYEPRRTRPFIRAPQSSRRGVFGNARIVHQRAFGGARFFGKVFFSGWERELIPRSFSQPIEP